MFESLTCKYTCAHAKYFRTMTNKMLKIQLTLTLKLTGQTPEYNSNSCDQILVHMSIKCSHIKHMHMLNTCPPKTTCIYAKFIPTINYMCTFKAHAHMSNTCRNAKHMPTCQNKCPHVKYMPACQNTCPHAK